MSAKEKKDTYMNKGDFFFKNKDWNKAIVYYTMAYEAYNNDADPLLKRAEAYENLSLLPQVEECYRIAFESKLKIDNVYKLKYAITLLRNNKEDEYLQWLKKYNQVIQEDIRGGNYISADRLKLYKDSIFTVTIKATQLDAEGVYKKEQSSRPVIQIDGFNYEIKGATMNSSGTTVYFSSVVPGNEGKSDIFTSRFVDNKWTKPNSLGASVNTSGNESSPFIYNDSILFFTSDGHSGFGGKDIYKVNLKYAEKKVINLGKEVNSSADEYDFLIAGGGNTGYCLSDREGGKPKVFRVEFIDVKLKYAYKPRLRTSMEENKINLLLSSGKEYNIASTSGKGFEFSFKPQEKFKVVFRKENIRLDEVVQNKNLTAEERKSAFISPKPLKKAEIELTPGIKYDFVSGKNPIDKGYLGKLKELVKRFKAPSKSTINLTALAKEMKFEDGQVYTIRFIPDENNIKYGAKNPSNLFVNMEEVTLGKDESIILVLPLKSEVNFNIQSDIASIEENFKPEKYAVRIEEGDVFEDEVSDLSKFLSLMVNTDDEVNVNPSNRISAKTFSIVPGTEYIMTLSKVDAMTNEKVDIIVPLTQGVRYNLSSSLEPDVEYKEALAEFLIGRKGVQSRNEEVIDISLLSKELEIVPGEELSFNLVPVKLPGKKIEVDQNIKSTVIIDGKDNEYASNEKFIVKIPVDINWKVNLQTDINYISENFEPDLFSLDIDTIPFFSEITVDTTGYSHMRETGWLVSMNVNTKSVEEVDAGNQLTAKDVSIIPGKEYILTVTKVDGITGNSNEIIVPLTRKVKYDFTSNPDSKEAYKESLDRFLEGREDIETLDGELIDINLLSKELQISEGDEISFSLLPVKDLKNKTLAEDGERSSLYLDNNVVEFTHIQKYTINVPLHKQRYVNIQTDVNYVRDNFNPELIIVDLDTIEFFSEIQVDTAGFGNRVYDEEIKDPVFDVVVVNFDLAKHSLKQEAKSIIFKKVISELKKDKRLYVTIKGYTDVLGDADYNLNLSRRRAESVKDYLTENNIGDSRIRTFSFGESQALDEGVQWEDLSEEELKKHRKVEIVIYLPE
jgi:outer membrane protein OmpA-like peptidoglycan-associated protein/tetratricopeptide (TPR) repeat protein